jgi:hypothetical protein
MGRIIASRSLPATMAFGLTRLRPVFAFFSVNFVERREWMRVCQGVAAPGAFWGTRASVGDTPVIGRGIRFVYRRHGD